MVNKLESYNEATKELVILAEDYEIPKFGKYSLPEIVQALRESFKYKLTYKKVFGDVIETECNPSTGFCLISSYYIYNSTGGKDTWTIMKNPVHWWLEHNIISGPFDITYDQFNNVSFPYRIKSKELRIPDNKIWTKDIYEKAMILGKCAGLE